VRFGIRFREEILNLERNSQSQDLAVKDGMHRTLDRPQNMYGLGWSSAVSTWRML